MKLAGLCWLLASGCAPCGGEVWVRVEAPDGAGTEVCAAVLTSDEERRAGLTALPTLEPGEGVLLRARVEAQLCITTAPLSYAIDVVFADASGRVVEVACNRSATDEGVCVDGVIDVLELLPQPGCSEWAGGSLEVQL